MQDSAPSKKSQRSRSRYRNTIVRVVLSPQIAEAIHDEAQMLDISVSGLLRECITPAFTVSSEGSPIKARRHYDESHHQRTTT